MAQEGGDRPVCRMWNGSPLADQPRGTRPHPSTRPSSPPGVVYAAEWLSRFRALYDAEAEDPRTSLGLFYERHRRFVAAPNGGGPNRPEYTYEEWNRAFAAFLGSLARDFGLVQTEDWTNEPQLIWIWHGRPERPAVTIREAKVATDSVVREDLPSVVGSGALLTVLVLYPDFPAPAGVVTFDEAIEHWRGRVGQELSNLGMGGEFLLTAISAFDWGLPAPWRGYAWHPVERAMKPV